jgi:aerobic-type carbon monoxide dehydrogenase small subunit (CoxS/CutS family)
MRVPPSITVNGANVDLSETPGHERLLDTLRWRIGLKGTKEGCRSGGCGACTVLVNGRSVLSCLTLTHEVAGAEVTTIEGLGSDPVGQMVIAAFEREGAVQCGYCTPGFVVVLTSLLKERGDRASSEEFEEDLHGNLCRCTGYVAIRAAIRTARKETRP